MSGLIRHFVLKEKGKRLIAQMRMLDNQTANSCQFADTGAQPAKSFDGTISQVRHSRYGRLTQNSSTKSIDNSI